MRNAFRSLRTRNYRLYFSGMVVSNVGTWMQIIANSWLVLRLSGNSGLAVGVRDRAAVRPDTRRRCVGWPDRRSSSRSGASCSRHRSLFLVQATALGVLTATGSARLWMVYAPDVPVRVRPSRRCPGASVVRAGDGLRRERRERGGPQQRRLQRIAHGRAGGRRVPHREGRHRGVLLRECRELPRDPHRASRSCGGASSAGRRMRHPRDAGRSAQASPTRLLHPDILLSIVLMAIVGTFTMNFQTVMPLFTKLTFHGDSTTFGWLSAVMAFGSVGGRDVHGDAPQVVDEARRRRCDRPRRRRDGRRFRADARRGLRRSCRSSDSSRCSSSRRRTA